MSILTNLISNLVQEMSNFGARQHIMKKKILLNVYASCYFTWENYYLQSFKHEFVAYNYLSPGALLKKEFCEMHMIKLIWLENWGVSMIINIQMENEKSRETLCIFSRSVELLPSNKSFLGALVGKNETKLVCLAS